MDTSRLKKSVFKCQVRYCGDFVRFALNFNNIVSSQDEGVGRFSRKVMGAKDFFVYFRSNGVYVIEFLLQHFELADMATVQPMNP